MIQHFAVMLKKLLLLVVVVIVVVIVVVDELTRLGRGGEGMKCDSSWADKPCQSARKV